MSSFGRRLRVHQDSEQRTSSHAKHIARKPPIAEECGSYDYDFVDPFNEADDVHEVEYGSTTSAVNSSITHVGSSLDYVDAKKDFSAVAVVGCTGAFRIFSIEENRLALSWDLTGKWVEGKHRLNAAVVKWSRDDSLVCTATTSGSLALWDFATEQLTGHILKAHERSINSFDFHPSDMNSLVSASTDGHVKQFDMRVFRKSAVAFNVLMKNNVHHVQFCSAENSNLFALCDDFGQVQFWDIRMSRGSWKEMKVHDSKVSAMDFAPEDHNLLVTAGSRESNNIKVWEWRKANSTSEPLYVIEANHAVSRVRWRKSKESLQVATCPVVSDFALNVYDICRPFLPFATFHGHRDCVTGVAYDGTGRDRFVSVGKDGNVIVGRWRDGLYPMRVVNNTVVDAAPDGLLALGVSRFTSGHKRRQGDFSFATEQELASVWGECGAEEKHVMDGCDAKLKCGQPVHSAPPLSNQILCHLAKGYRLGGAHPMELAYYNAIVAEKLSMEHVAKTWRNVATLIWDELHDTEYAKVERMEEGRRRKERMAHHAFKMEKEAEWYALNVLGGAKRNEGDRPHLPTLMPLDERGEQIPFNVPMYDPGFELEMFREPEDKSQREGGGGGKEERGRSAMVERGQLEVMRRDSDAPFRDVRAEVLLSKAEMRHRVIPRAFPKSCKDKALPAPDEDVHKLKDESLGDLIAEFGAFHFGTCSGSGRRRGESDARWDGTANSAFAVSRTLHRDSHHVPKLNPHLQHIVKQSNGYCRSYRVEGVNELLQERAERGDVQTCACICIVFGRVLVDQIDGILVRTWIEQYEEMLRGLQMFMEASEVRSHYDFYDDVVEDRNAGMHILLGCMACGKALDTKGQCTRCTRRVDDVYCSLCHRRIDGLLWSCGGCLHALHSEHAKDWFTRFNRCPVFNCDCECTFWTSGNEKGKLLVPLEAKEKEAKKPQEQMTVEHHLYLNQVEEVVKMEERRSRKFAVKERRNTFESVEGDVLSRWKRRCRLQRHGHSIVEGMKVPQLSESSEEEVYVVIEGHPVKTTRPKEKKRRRRARRSDDDFWEKLEKTKSKRAMEAERRLRVDERRRRKEMREKERLHMESHSSDTHSVVSSVDEEEDEEDDDVIFEREEETNTNGEEKEEKRRKRYTSVGGETEEAHDEKALQTLQEEREETVYVDPLEERRRRCWCEQCEECRRWEDRRFRRDCLVRMFGRRRDRALRCLRLVHRQQREMARKRRWGVKSSKRAIFGSSRYQRERKMNSRRRQPAEWSKAFSKFTLETMGEMFEWHAVHWQRQLQCRRLIPRAFYRHSTFTIPQEEMDDLPLRDLLERAADLEKTLGVLGIERLRRRTRTSKSGTRWMSTGWRRRGRGRSGCSFPPSTSLFLNKSKGMRRIISLRSAFCLPTRRRMKLWKPAKLDPWGKLFHGKETPARPLQPMRGCERKLDDWWRREPKERLKAFMNRRVAHVHWKESRPHAELSYSRWARLREQEFHVESSKRREVVRGGEGEEERKRRAVEQEREIEYVRGAHRLIQQHPYIFNKKYGDGGSVKPVNVFLQPPSAKDSAAPATSTFMDTHFFTEEDCARISDMQVRLDDYNRIRIENMVTEEKERVAQESRLDRLKRETARRHFNVEQRKERATPPRDSSLHSLFTKDKKVMEYKADVEELMEEEMKEAAAKEKHALTKREREKTIRLLHAKLIAKGVAPLLDLHTL